MSKGKSQYSKKKARQRFKPVVAQWRLELVRLLVLIAAFCLIVYDAYVSYRGFQKIRIGEHAPIIFSLLIFVVQLGVGILHALGDDFGDIVTSRSDSWENKIWGYFLVVIYAIDTLSNVIEFGFFSRFSTPLIDPVEQIGGALLIIGLGFGLTFADETLLRLYDRVDIAVRRNNIFSRRYKMTVDAHNRYISTARSLALEKAELQAQNEGANWQFGEHL